LWSIALHEKKKPCKAKTTKKNKTHSKKNKTHSSLSNQNERVTESRSFQKSQMGEVIPEASDNGCGVLLRVVTLFSSDDTLL
jgi:hypothetical protein